MGISTTADVRTTLRVFQETAPGQAPRVVTDEAAITSELAAIGVNFEHHAIDRPALLGDDPGTILDACAAVVAHVQRNGDFGIVDVVRVTPHRPTSAAIRAKFLAEHTHGDDEVRYFVDGCGAFYLRYDRCVYQVICTQGDLIGVPAQTRHWFDMGPQPNFIAIRWFNDPDGWVGNFTGDPVAERFPLFDEGGTPASSGRQQRI